MALSALACLGAYALAWASLGFALTPWWWASLAAPLAWLAGLAGRRPGGLVAGMFLMVAVVGLSTVRGAPALGLIALGLLLWGWDLGWLELALARYRDRDRAGGKALGGASLDHPGLVKRAASRAAGAVAAGVLAGLVFSALRLSLPFWGMMAGALTAWAGAVALILVARMATGGR